MGYEEVWGSRIVSKDRSQNSIKILKNPRGVTCSMCHIGMVTVADKQTRQFWYLMHMKSWEKTDFRFGFRQAIYIEKHTSEVFLRVFWAAKFLDEFHWYDVIASNSCRCQSCVENCLWLHYLSLAKVLKGYHNGQVPGQLTHGWLTVDLRLTDICTLLHNPTKLSTWIDASV
jgi:hypothetical protein